MVSMKCPKNVTYFVKNNMEKNNMGWVIPTNTRQEQEVIDSHLKQLPRIDWLEHYRNVEAPFARMCESLTDLDKLTVFSLPVGIANRWIEYIIRKEESRRPSSWDTDDLRKMRQRSIPVVLYPI